MWYFAWILGLPLAAGFAVLNGMWYEMTEDAHARAALPKDTPPASGVSEEKA